MNILAQVSEPSKVIFNIFSFGEDQGDIKATMEKAVYWASFVCFLQMNSHLGLIQALWSFFYREHIHLRLFITCTYHFWAIRYEGHAIGSWTNRCSPRGVNCFVNLLSIFICDALLSIIYYWTMLYKLIYML